MKHNVNSTSMYRILPYSSQIFKGNRRSFVESLHFFRLESYTLLRDKPTPCENAVQHQHPTISHVLPNHTAALTVRLLVSGASSWTTEFLGDKLAYLPNNLLHIGVYLPLAPCGEDQQRVKYGRRQQRPASAGSLRTHRRTSGSRQRGTWRLLDG